MLAISVRVSPCRARFCLLSSARVTVIFPSSRAMDTFSWNVRASWPFGPFTVTMRPSSFTSTPLGITTGMRPIRLMRSPHVRQDLATEALALRLTPGHDARGGRNDRDTHAAEYARDLGLARVHPKARLADAANPRHRRQLADEFQPQKDLARARLLETGDKALVAQDACDLELRPARRDAHGLVAGGGRRPCARPQVGGPGGRRPPALLPAPLWRGPGRSRGTVDTGLPSPVAHPAPLLF